MRTKVGTRLLGQFDIDAIAVHLIGAALAMHTVTPWTTE
jgi:hypothetical protein